MSLLEGMRPVNSPSERKELKTDEEHEEERRLSYNIYQKKRRDQLRKDYMEQKELIDSLDDAALQKFVLDNKSIAHETRVGVNTMKANPYEHAAIKLAIAKSGARSARELFLTLIEESGLLDPGPKRKFKVKNR